MTPDNPLPEFEKQFDLITAFQPVFFMYRPEGYGRLWDLHMWNTFSSKLNQAVSTRGRFYLGAKDMSGVDNQDVAEMLQYFRKKGAKPLSDGWIFQKENL